MDITGKLGKYIKNDVSVKTTKSDFIVMEQSDLSRIAKELERNMKKLEKRKGVSVSLLMDFKRLSQHVKDIVDQPLPGVMDEKFVGFGSNGTAELHGKDLIISKNGHSVEITKKELVDILKKLGMVKNPK